MQKFLHYDKWIGNITGHDLTESDYCISILTEEIDNKNLRDYIVYKNELIKKDHIVRTLKEKQFTNIECNDDRSIVTLNVFPDDAIIEVVIDTYLLQQYTDPYQFDNIQFTEPILKIFVHSKKSPELLGTLEIDLNEYIKTGRYKQDISVILSKVNITDLVFKTQRCFENYAYEIFEHITEPKLIDKNLIDKDYHIITTYNNNTLTLTHQIKYWQEFHHHHNDKIVLSFTDIKNKHALDFYVKFQLWQLQKNNSITFDVPKSIVTKKLNVNVNWLKIKYENTDN